MLRRLFSAASRHAPAGGSTRALSTAVRLTKGVVRHVESLVSRHDALLESMAAGEFSTAGAKEMARLEPLTRAHALLRETVDEVAGLREMASDASSEKELRELARAELEAAEAALPELEAAIIRLIVPPDPEEENAAVKGMLMELHAGVGGAEAALFAQDLLQMYQLYSKRKGWRCETISHTVFEMGGCREATLSISGEGAYAALRGENGTHRVQRVPATEAAGRVHTSTAMVAVLPELDVADVPELKEARDYYRTPRLTTNIYIYHICLYIYLYLYIFIYLCMYTYFYLYVYLFICIYMYMHAYLHV